MALTDKNRVFVTCVTALSGWAIICLMMPPTIEFDGISSDGRITASNCYQRPHNSSMPKGYDTRGG